VNDGEEGERQEDEHEEEDREEEGGGEAGRGRGDAECRGGGGDEHEHRAEAAIADAPLFETGGAAGTARAWRDFYNNFPNSRNRSSASAPATLNSAGTIDASATIAATIVGGRRLRGFMAAWARG
jgi:hypothetical protein